MMSPFVVFLYLLQFSSAFPMHFGHRGSNSEEGMPYGPFNYMNMQMPPGASAYGLGFPHYSQMIQLQHALAQQPWLQQNAATSQQHNREAPSPRFQINPPQSGQQQTQLNRPQHQSTYQHITPQPQRPLQPLPAPDPQMPQMFSPFLGGMNPFQPYWPQGNYYGLFGFGNRPAYNSEEANEDEEATKPEKESPKAESPVTESSNATAAETNSTTVDPNQGSNATHNASLVGENSQINGPDSQNLSPAAGTSMLDNQERSVNPIPGSFRPAHPMYRSAYQQSMSRNPQHRYYTINKILVGRGDRQNIIRQPEHLNKVSSNQMLYTRGTQPAHVNAPSSRTDVLRRSYINEPRAFLQESGANNPKNQGLLPTTETNGRNLAAPVKHFENRQVREQSSWHINKNNLPNQNAILVRPHRNEYLPPYRSQPVNVDQKQNAPRGLFSNQQNIQSQTQNKGSDQKSNMYQNKANTVSQAKQVLQKPDDFLRQSEVLPYEGEGNVYEKNGRVYHRGNSWNNRHSNRETINLHSGPQQETVFILNPIASSDVLVYPDNSPRQGSGSSFNNAWEKAIEHESPIGQRNINIYPENDSLGQRNINIYPENGFYDQTNSVPKQTWDNDVGFKISQNDHLDPTIDTQHIPEHPVSQDLYIINDRAPAGERRYVFISNVDPTKQTEDSHIPAARHLSQVKHTSMRPHKVANSFDRNSYFVGHDANSQTQTKNILHGTNTVFQTRERYNVGSDVPLDQGDSVHIQLSPYSELNSWSFNPDDFLPSQTENTNYEMYPSGMRGQPVYQRQMDYGGSRHYMCTLPISEVDQTREHSNQLLYVCCKLSDVPSGTPPSPNPNYFRLTLNEYNEWVPYQDRAHRQHTRNVIDLPKVTYNQNSNTLHGSNSTNNIENTMMFVKENSEASPCITKGCHEQTLNHPYHDVDIVDSKPCSARGDLDIDPSASPSKKIIAYENPDGPLINTQDDGLLHRRLENDVRPKKATGKLLRILTCSKDKQIHSGNILKGQSGGKPFSLKHDVPIALAATVATTITHDECYQPLESKKDPASNVPDCLILNK